MNQTKKFNLLPLRAYKLLRSLSILAISKNRKKYILCLCLFMWMFLMPVARVELNIRRRKWEIHLHPILMKKPRKIILLPCLRKKDTRAFTYYGLIDPWKEPIKSKNQCFYEDHASSVSHLKFYISWRFLSLLKNCLELAFWHGWHEHRAFE